MNNIFLTYKMELVSKIIKIIIISICVIGCANSDKPEKIDNTSNKVYIDNIQPSLSNFSIIKIDTIPPYKYSIDIRLEKECKKSEIEQLAYYIKKNVIKETYQTIFISYYLPKMKVDEVAWATSHFNPDLEIFMTSPAYNDIKPKENINVSETDIAINEFIDKNRSCKIIGTWYEGKDFLIFIFKKNSKNYLAEMNIKTQNISEYELLTKKYKEQQTFIIKKFLEPPRNGIKPIGDYTDYYTIEANGDLSLFDNIGLIERYKLISQKK